MTPFHQKFFINKSLQDILQRNENIARKKTLGYHIDSLKKLKENKNQQYLRNK